jgi:hypothetical protein
VLGGRRVERVAELRGCAVAIESSRISRSVSSFADVLGVDFTTQDTSERYCKHTTDFCYIADTQVRKAES